MGLLVSEGSLLNHGEEEASLLPEKANKPSPVVLVRIDFKTRIVTFFVNGVEAKSEPPVTLPEGEGSSFPVVRSVCRDDEVESLAENDPAFNVLFQQQQQSSASTTVS